MSDSGTYPFGDVLRQFRGRARISQRELAELLGVHRNTIGGWERGDYLPAHADVLRLAEILCLEEEDKNEFLRSRYGYAPQASRSTATFWNVPFGRNPFFTGRTQLLSTLRDKLAQTHGSTLTQPLALTGLGGVGKTQVAIEYAYRYRDEYRAVFWVRAANRETLISDFVGLAHLLDLPGTDIQDQMLIVAGVKRWFTQHDNWLLILDNTDEPTLLKDFLPIEGAGHILLTTRAQATGRIASSVLVEKMEVSESIKLLLRRAKLLGVEEPLDNLSHAVRTQAQHIVQALDSLPLALDQAGAYIEEIGCSLSEYLTLFEERRLELFKRQSKLASIDYPYTVASTWAISFKRVEQANPAAGELLRLCAFLDPDAIPEAIITEGADVIGPVLGPAAADSFLFYEAIQTLRRYSLIKRDPEAKLLNVHRLVQEVVRDNLEPGMRRHWAERTIRAVSRAFPEVSFDTWSLCESIMPHVHACVDLIDEYHLGFPQAVRLLHQAGIYVRDRGLYEQAEPLLQRSLQMSENVLGPERPETASILNDLGWLYYHLGKYVQAESLYKRALAIREQVLGALHPETATTLNDLALLYEDQRLYEKAEPLLKRALAIREEVLKSEHPDVGESLNNLAILYYLQAKFEEAEPLFQHALSIREQALGPGHPATAQSLDNLAVLYRCLDNYEQAESFHQRALAIFEQALGNEHPDTAQSLDNLAVLYRYLGKYEQAESLHQRALAVFEQVLGPEHPDTAIALHNLAQLYHSQGQYEQAHLLYQRALTIFEKVLGPEHLRVAQCLHNLANLFVVIGQYEYAEPLYQRALIIHEQSLGAEHPETVEVRRDYNDLLHIRQAKHPFSSQEQA